MFEVLGYKEQKDRTSISLFTKLGKNVINLYLNTIYQKENHLLNKNNKLTFSAWKEQNSEFCSFYNNEWFISHLGAL